MHLRTRPVLFFLGILLVGAAAAVVGACGGDDGGEATPAADASSPVTVVERFFHGYVSERTLGKDPMARKSLEANPDVTPQFTTAMTAITATGRDPMLCSGEVPHSFSADQPSLSGTASTVVVASDVSAAAWKVDLVQQNSAWRINAINCVVR